MAECLADWDAVDAGRTAADSISSLSQQFSLPINPATYHKHTRLVPTLRLIQESSEQHDWLGALRASFQLANGSRQAPHSMAYDFEKRGGIGWLGRALSL